MNRQIITCLWAILLLVGISCSKQESPTQTETESIGTPAPSKRQPQHPTEERALKFLGEIKVGKYASAPYRFNADNEFSEERRTELFRDLEKYIKQHEWHLWYTLVEIYNGEEDSADVTLRSAKGEYLVLFFGYYYDVKQWRLGAYEFPIMTFRKPKGISFREYIESGIVESKRVAVPSQQKDVIGAAGSYYIE